MYGKMPDINPSTNLEESYGNINKFPSLYGKIPQVSVTNPSSDNFSQLQSSSTFYGVSEFAPSIYSQDMKKKEAQTTQVNSGEQRVSFEAFYNWTKVGSFRYLWESIEIIFPN